MTRSILATALATLALSACGGGGSSDSPASDPSAPPSAEADPMYTPPDPDLVFVEDPRDEDCSDSIATYATAIFGQPVDTIFIDGAATGTPSSETLFFENSRSGELMAFVFEFGDGVTGCRGSIG